MLEVKMKRLNSTPASLPLPNPEEILRNLTWLDELDSEVVDDIVQCASLVQFERGDSIHKQDEMLEGIYIIVSGLVKVLACVRACVRACACVCVCVYASVCHSPHSNHLHVVTPYTVGVQRHSSS